MQATLAKRAGLPDILNLLSAFVLSAWYCIPALSSYTALFLIAAALWLCSARGLLLYLADNALKYLALCLYLAVSAVYLLSAPGDAVFAGTFRATLLGLFCVVMLDYYLERQRVNDLKYIGLFGLLCFTGCAAASLLFFPDDITKVKLAVSIGIEGGVSVNFGSFYAAVFLLAGGLFLLIRGGRSYLRLLGAAASVVSCMLLVFGQFTLSIMLAALLLLLIAINAAFRPRFWAWLILFALLAALFVLLTANIADWMRQLAALLPQGYVSERFADMAAYLNHDSSIHSATRIGIYLDDLKAFGGAPLTGLLPLQAAASGAAMPGGHSSLFMMLAQYGLFGSAAFFFFFYQPLIKAGSLWRGQAHSVYWLPCLFCFLLLGCVDPVFNVQTLCFVMMLVLPALPLMVKAPAAKKEDGQA